jgi:hypothetical protein
MRPSEQYGIVARFAGHCGLCGQPTEVGARIFHLPAKRRGATQDPWVCRGCRYPNTRGEITLDDVLTKIAHRFGVGKPASLNARETELLAEPVRATGRPRVPSRERFSRDQETCRGESRRRCSQSDQRRPDRAS